MEASDAYKRNQTDSWTRIDMLLALYEGLIDSIQQAAQAHADGNETSTSSYLLKSNRILIGLFGGIDDHYGDFSDRMKGLYAFVLRSLSRYEFNDALRVLKTLDEAFRSIRTEATRLELEGKIPRSHDASVALEIRA